MPIIVPPFVSYQAPLFPIAGKWHHKPPEGDKFIPCEIDWGVSVPLGQAVQFALNAGPVEFSQIIALGVDNGRNGGSVSFLFPDTGKQLTLPPFAQGTYPVFTNSLTFYAVGEGVSVGDVTVFEVLNSMPPPVSVLPAQLQSHASASSIDLTANAGTVIVPAGVNGTLQGFTISSTGLGGGTGQASVFLQDGTGVNFWAQFITEPNGSLAVTQTGLQLRFTNGVRFAVGGSTLTSGSAVVNVYYSVP